jgi:hypothetical protein
VFVTVRRSKPKKTASSRLERRAGDRSLKEGGVGWRNRSVREIDRETEVV